MSTTAISKEVEFDLGHRVMMHESKCANVHGHRYRLRATCAGTVVDEGSAPDDGMLVDFGDLKRWMTVHVHDVLDHGFVHHVDDPVGKAILHVLPGSKVIAVPFTPTAENLARWCYEQLEPLIDEHWRGNLQLSMVELWETPTSLAMYER